MMLSRTNAAGGFTHLAIAVMAVGDSVSSALPTQAERRVWQV